MQPPNRANMAVNSLQMLQSTFLNSDKFYLWQQQRGNSAKILMQHWLLLTCRGCMHCPNALMTYSHTFLQFEKVEHNAVFIWSGHCASTISLGDSCINIVTKILSLSSFLSIYSTQRQWAGNTSFKQLFIAKIAKEHYWNAMSTSDIGPSVLHFVKSWKCLESRLI